MVRNQKFIMKLYFCLPLIVSVIVADDDKRLLLNDPDVIMRDVIRLQNTFALLNNSVTQLTNKVKQQETEIANLSITNKMVKSQLDQAIATKNLGSTYINWGRKSCPSTAETIYSGYVAGGLYSDPGSAAESLCLPTEPQFNRTSITNGASHAVIYGAEYHSLHFFRPNGEDIPCAACRVPSPSVIMIPGRHSCYSGWNREYYGYLASGATGQAAASSYICIDIKAEDLDGGEHTVKSRYFYPVIVHCQPLQCPPYHQNYPLTCVVCSK